ncbi:MAG: DNA-binding protein WhiA [Oscillospiraceae bacterium]|nr:DNA-binding protein WhiA [Oscillospiraceae bacterium]
MTFSARAKAEICRIGLSRHCCAVAEAYGALLFASVFSAREIRIIYASSDVAARLPRLFKRAFGLEFDTLPEAAEGKRALTVTDTEKIAAVFAAFGLEAGTTLAHHINLGVLESECCRAAFVRGAFLTGGSVTDPEKNYHLELVTDHMSVSREMLALLLEMGFEPKYATRAGHYVVYFKSSEAIEDFLTTVGASASALELMSAKVEKDIRNAVNRRVNCDSANADKIVSAAQAQLDHIRELERTIGLDNLPTDLHQTALLRIANPDASLADLAALSCPPVSKSCINHRLRKLMNFRQN